MRNVTLFALAMVVPMFGLSSCATEAEKQKVAGPRSESSRIPWNTPVPGQGQGAFGMMQQNKPRR